MTTIDPLAGSKEWFKNAGLGLFIHWGLYSIPAGVWKGEKYPWFGEWIMNVARIPIAEYEALAGQFNPVRFNASEWVELAERAGMRYIGITAKHHEGFALFDSQVDDYNIMKATPFGRDPLQELAEACRGTSVKLCFYYSQAQDWHEPHGGNLPEDTATLLDYGNTWDFPEGGTPEGYAEYLERKVFPQVKELLSNYGPVAIMWFDNPIGSWTRENASYLRDLVRSLQPACLISNRIGFGCGDIVGFGDFEFPRLMQNQLAEVNTSMMMETYGYKKHAEWRSAEEIVKMTEDAKAKNCNLLINIGPKADGSFPEEAVDRLNHLAMIR